jgi:hypothetical protein
LFDKYSACWAEDIFEHDGQSKRNLFHCKQKVIEVFATSNVTGNQTYLLKEYKKKQTLWNRYLIISYSNNMFTINSKTKYSMFSISPEYRLKPIWIWKMLWYLAGKDIFTRKFHHSFWGLKKWTIILFRPNHCFSFGKCC